VLNSVDPAFIPSRDGSGTVPNTGAESALFSLLPFFRGRGGRLLGALLVTLTNAALGIIPPLCVKAIIDIAIPTRNGNYLLLLGSAMLAVGIATGLLSYYYATLFTRISEEVCSKIRSTVLMHICYLPIAFFYKTGSGAISSRAVEDVESLSSQFSNVYAVAISNLTVVTFTMAAMLLLDWRLGLGLITLAMVALVPIRRAGKHMLNAQRAARAHRDVVVKIATTWLSPAGVLLCKTFSREPLVLRTFLRAASVQMRSDLANANSTRRFAGFINALFSLTPAAVWFIGGVVAVSRGVEIGTIVALMGYLTRINGPIASLLNLPAQITTTRALCERIFEYTEERVEAFAIGQPVPARISAVRFENVSFSYDGERLALDEASFEVERGSTLAIVGASGSGKTTIVSLLARLHEPQSGRVMFGNTNIATLDLASLRSAIGIVSQQSFLTGDSLLENLRLARPGATRHEVELACKDAHLEDLIEGLPNGLDSLMGERGVRLSGGEQQRVSIARVLLRRPQIIVLDEATSSLDALTELSIRDTLSRYMAGTTNFIIAHRLAVTTEAAAIVVLEAGRVVGFGPHEELLKSCAQYWSLHHASVS